MSKKDYIELANIMRGNMARDPGLVRDIAENIASVCAADNPLFDRARFLKACGVAS